MPEIQPSSLPPASIWPNVGELHQALVEAGYALPAVEIDLERYGPGTHAAVEAYQRAAGLVADGVAGPRTWAALQRVGAGVITGTDPGWRCDANDARPAVRGVIEAARGEIGQVEAPPGSNRGPRIDLYTAPNLGIPWCAAFASWCYRRSAPASPFGRRLSVWSIWEWARERDRLVVGQPIPGDLALVRRPGRRGHIGIVVGILPDGRWCLVEGNARNAVRGTVRAPGAMPELVRPVSL